MHKNKSALAASMAKPAKALALDGEPERRDKSRLIVILAAGFGVAGNYDSLNRDRYEISLKDGVTIDGLYRFCSSHLKGSPIPRGDPITDGPTLLRLFKAAEAANLVALRFIKADSFIPEKSGV